jgi:hypothetical protein
MSPWDILAWALAISGVAILGTATAVIVGAAAKALSGNLKRTRRYSVDD